MAWCAQAGLHGAPRCCWYGFATPDANITPEQAADFVRRVIEGFAALQPYLDQAAVKRGEELLEAHRRVRTASQIKGISYRIEAQLPPDVLGIYVYLPKI